MALCEKEPWGPEHELYGLIDESDWNCPPLRASISSLEHAVMDSPRVLSQLDNFVLALAEELAPHGREPSIPDPTEHAFDLASCVLDGGSQPLAQAIIWLRTGEILTAIALDLMAIRKHKPEQLAMARAALKAAAEALGGSEPGLWTAAAHVFASDVITESDSAPDCPSVRAVADAIGAALVTLTRAEMIDASPESEAVN